MIHGIAIIVLIVLIVLLIYYIAFKSDYDYEEVLNVNAVVSEKQYCPPFIIYKTISPVHLHPNNLPERYFITVTYGE